MVISPKLLGQATIATLKPWAVAGGMAIGPRDSWRGRTGPHKVEWIAARGLDLLIRQQTCTMHQTIRDFHISDKRSKAPWISNERDVPSPSRVYSKSVGSHEARSTVGSE